MENHPAIPIIRKCTHDILTCGEDFFLMKQSVDRLFTVFSEITGVTNDNYQEEQIFLPSGKAISPSGAAHCLLEMKRTAIFLRGINKAIQQKVSEKDNHLVQILYAGTGPFGTLMLPFMAIYAPNDFQVDLLDINEISKNALEKLIGELGLNQFIDKSYLCDATTFISEKRYDIVISETMQAALKKEPQVAIMQNLIPQMGEDTIFIPEAITVTVALFSNGYWDSEKSIQIGNELIMEKELFTVDKQHLDSSNYHNELILPAMIEYSKRLFLNTQILTYKDEVLKDGDCSLTLPVKIVELNSDQTGIIRFWYEQGEVPGVRCQIAGSEKIFDATGKKDWRDNNQFHFATFQ